MHMDPLAGYSTVIAVISIMFAVAGIVYGLGYALDQRRLKEFGTNELFEALFGVALIGILAWVLNPSGLLSSLSSYVPAGTQIPGPQECPIQPYNYAICYALGYLQGTQQSVISMLYSAVDTYVLIGTLASIKLDLIVSIGLSGLNFALGPLSGLIDLLTAVLVLIVMQVTILTAIPPLAANIFLPLGMVLRAFFFTRNLGGLFLAIAVGFSVVYPMTFFLNSQIVSSNNVSISSANYKNVVDTFDSISESAMDIFNLSSLNRILADNQSTTYNSLVGFISSGPNSISQLLSTLIDYATFYVGELIISTFLLPLIDIALTVISIRELSKILGSDIQLGRVNLLWFSI